MGIKADLEGKKVSFKLRLKIDEGGGKYHYEDVEHYGSFLMFGCDYEDMGQNCGNFSTAIILMSDGTMVNLSVQDVKFI